MVVEKRSFSFKASAEGISSHEASVVLRKRILRFSKSMGDRSGIELFECDNSGDGLLYDTGETGARTINKEELKEVAKKVMAEFGLNETVSRAQRRTEVDLSTNKITPNSYTEYRKYPTGDRDLVFKRVQVIKNSILQSESWSIEGIHSQLIVKSPLIPKPSR